MIKKKFIKQLNQNKGFSLVEVLVTLAILGIMLTGVIAVNEDNWQNWSKGTNLNLLHQDLQNSVDFIAEKVRQADQINIVPGAITHLLISKNVGGTNHVYDISMSADSLEMSVDGGDTINLLSTEITFETGSGFTMPEGESTVKIVLVGKKDNQKMSVETTAKPRIWGFN